MEAVAPHRRLAGRYVLQELVATGGMASVWRAMDEVLARTVAIKVLRADPTADGSFAQRFQTQAVAAARLTHPNIVSVFDTGIDQGVHYIVMEFLRGRTLREVMAEEGAIDPDRAVDVIVPVLAALSFAHQAGILHRDIKPANILVGEDGRVKVTDFGIAKAAFAETNLTRTGSMIGTVRYISPEQVEGGPVDGRTDVYSAGIVLYEMLVGQPPFLAETDVATAIMRLTQEPAPPRERRPLIPRPLEAVVLRALSRRPEDRFASADAMQASLERLRSRGEPPPAQGLPRSGMRVAGPSPRGVRPGVVVSVIAAILLAVGAVVAAVVVTRSGTNRPAGAHRSTPPASAIHEVTIARAQDWDPQGDGSEDPQDVPLVLDGDPSTAWWTDHYNTASFGNLKQGLGLWLDLGRDVKVRRVRIRAPVTGWTFRLEAGPFGAPGRTLRSIDGATTFTVTSATLTVDLRPTTTAGLLIWITKLGADGGSFAAAVGDVWVFAG